MKIHPMILISGVLIGAACLMPQLPQNQVAGAGKVQPRRVVAEAVSPLPARSLSQPLTEEQKKAAGYVSIESKTPGLKAACAYVTGKILRDPESFKHIRTEVFKAAADEVQWANVVVTYRAKNGFGGYTVNQTGCGFSQDGELVAGPHTTPL